LRKILQTAALVVATLLGAAQAHASCGSIDDGLGTFIRAERVISPVNQALLAPAFVQARDALTHAQQTGQHGWLENAADLALTLLRHGEVAAAQLVGHHALSVRSCEPQRGRMLLMQASAASPRVLGEAFNREAYDRLAVQCALLGAANNWQACRTVLLERSDATDPAIRAALEALCATQFPVPITHEMLRVALEMLKMGPCWVNA